MSASALSLHHAQSRHEFVRLHRSIEGADEIMGYVVGLGSEWVVVSVFSDGSANGWTTLPLQDVVAVSSAPGGRFVRRGLESRRAWPSSAPPASLALSHGPDALIVSAASCFPLVTLYDEREDPFHCFIGRPVSWNPYRLLWQEMNRAAAWEEDPCAWDLSSITRIDIGGRYETALARVAQLRGL